MMLETNWKRIIKNPKEELIFKALEDEKWEWRTVPALAKASELTPSEVRKVLAKYPTLVRTAATLSQEGEALYTLQTRFYSRKSFFQKGWDFLGTSTGSNS